MLSLRRRDVARIFHDAAEPFLADRALGEDDYARAARDLEIRKAWPQTITHIESLQQPFGPAGEPVIRIEDGYWRRLAFNDRARGFIRELKPLNPADQAQRWANFHELYAVDPSAAVRSCSWGAFQIMGDHCGDCGFADPLLWLEAMRMGAGAQTMAFVRFVKASPLLHQALKRGDAPAIALHYNGRNYAQNRYDVKLRQGFARFDVVSIA